MTIFQNSFFSIAGQVERIQNVGATLVAAVTGKGVQSNTGNSVVDSVLSKAASNPFGTALAAAVVANPTAALGTAKAAFNSLSPTGKIVAGVSAPVVISAAVSNPKIITSVANAPKNLSSFGSDLGTLTKTPSINNLSNLISDNKAISAIIGVGAISAIGAGTSGTIATILNTQAVKKNTTASLPGVISSGTGTNKFDAKIAETNAQAATQLAKVQSKAPKTAATVSPNEISSPVAAVTAKKKKKVAKKKKKVAKKKKVTPKKKKKSKTIKRKSTKKKSKR